MKRSLYISIGLLALLPVSQASALGNCTNEPLARQALSLTPVSEYTAAVLERVTKAVGMAQSAEQVKIDDIYKLNWLPQVQSAMNELIDSNTHLYEEQRMLGERTTCLAIDAAILEAAIEDVRCELNRAYNDGRAADIGRLSDIMLFTHERYEALLRGADDPGYEDENWQRIYPFEDFSVYGSVACAKTDYTVSPVPVCGMTSPDDCITSGGAMYVTMYGCAQDGNAVTGTPPTTDDAVCPFSSDYLPPIAGEIRFSSRSSSSSSSSGPSSAPSSLPFFSLSSSSSSFSNSSSSSSIRAAGYGCDEEILDKYYSFGAVYEELYALENLIDTRTEFAEELEELGSWNNINQSDADLTHFNAFLHREHKSFNGCFDKLIDHAELKQFIEDSEFDTASGSNMLYQMGLTTQEPQGYFSFFRSEIRIMSDFMRLRNEWAGRRAQQMILRNGSQYGILAVDQVNTGSTIFGLFGIFGTTIQRIGQYATIDRSERQAPREAIGTTLSFDGATRLARRMAPLLDSTTQLIDLARNPNSGFRGFGRNFAWYLRRSCLERPGNAQLDKVLKLMLEPACFPYTSGQFVAGSTMDACADALN